MQLSTSAVSVYACFLLWKTLPPLCVLQAYTFGCRATSALWCESWSLRGLYQMHDSAVSWLWLASWLLTLSLALQDTASGYHH